MTNVKNRSRKRAIPYIFGNPRLDELLEQLIASSDWRLRAYIYRIQGEEKVLPAVFVGAPFPGLCEWLRDELGGGDFYIMIRRCKQMKLSGIICIGAPRARVSASASRDRF